MSGFCDGDGDPMHYTAEELGDLDGAALLDELHAFLGRFVAFPSEAAHVAATLWPAHAHSAGCFESTPRFALLSPEPGSGKTRTLEVFELLTPNPMLVLSASPPAIFRSIEKGPLTLLFDECDAIFTKHGKDDSNEDLRALLNAGHRKGASIPRCVGALHDVRQFQVYSPVALAGLGDLPATLMSRAVIIRMRKRKPEEQVEPFRYRIAAPEGHELRDLLAAWSGHVAERLTEAWPAMPPGVTDRPADVWEPLLAIADAAGGDWPKRARAACAELTTAAGTAEASLGVRLLTDLYAVFAITEERDGELVPAGITDALSTAAILSKLQAIEEAPWASFGKPPKPLDARGLASRLRGYEVTSTTIRVGEITPKGYRAADLYDSWARYVPGFRQSATSATPQQPQADALFPVADDKRVAEASATPDPAATDSGPLTSDVAPVADVADLREAERSGGWGADTIGAAANPSCAECGGYTAPGFELCLTCERASQ